MNDWLTLNGCVSVCRLIAYPSKSVMKRLKHGYLDITYWIELTGHSKYINSITHLICIVNKILKVVLRVFIWSHRNTNCSKVCSIVVSLPDVLFTPMKLIFHNHFTLNSSFHHGSSRELITLAFLLKFFKCLLNTSIGFTVSSPPKFRRIAYCNNECSSCQDGGSFEAKPHTIFTRLDEMIHNE